MKTYRRLLKRLWRVLAQKKVIKPLTMPFLQVSPSTCSQSFVYLIWGIILLVRDLHDRGIRTAVVSNGDSRIRGWHWA